MLDQAFYALVKDSEAKTAMHLGKLKLRGGNRTLPSRSQSHPSRGSLVLPYLLGMSFCLVAASDSARHLQLSNRRGECHRLVLPPHRGWQEAHAHVYMVQP